MPPSMTFDDVVAEFIKLASLATRVLNEHTNDHDLCAVCGSAWPCERVVLADHNFDLSHP